MAQRPSSGDAWLPADKKNVLANPTVLLFGDVGILGYLLNKTKISRRRAAKVLTARLKQDPSRFNETVVLQLQLL